MQKSTTFAFMSANLSLTVSSRAEISSARLFFKRNENNKNVLKYLSVYFQIGANKRCEDLFKN